MAWNEILDICYVFLSKFSPHVSLKWDDRPPLRCNHSLSLFSICSFFFWDKIDWNRDGIVFMWLDGHPLSGPNLISSSAKWQRLGCEMIYEIFRLHPSGFIFQLINFSWQGYAVLFSQPKLFIEGNTVLLMAQLVLKTGIQIKFRQMFAFCIYSIYYLCLGMRKL